MFRKLLQENTSLLHPFDKEVQVWSVRNNLAAGLQRPFEGCDDRCPLGIGHMLGDIQREHCIELPRMLIDEVDNITDMELAIHETLLVGESSRLLYERLRKVNPVVLAYALREKPSERAVAASDVEDFCADRKGYMRKDWSNASRLLPREKPACISIVVQILEIRWMRGLVHS